MLLENLLIKALEFSRDLLFPKVQVRNPGSLYVGRAQDLFNREKNEEIYISGEELNSHGYIIGSTGSGKSTCLSSFIRQTILSGKGFALVDHSGLADEVVRFIAAIYKNKPDHVKKEIAERLVLIEPGLENVVGFNPLEVKKNYMVYQTVLELLNVFRSRWSDSFSLGPRTEQVFRNCLAVLIENKLTLLETNYFLGDKRFRQRLLSNFPVGEVKNFWSQTYDKLSDRQKILFGDPMANKVGEFTADPYIRCIIGSEKSTFDFREIMDKEKWLIINVEKNKLKSNFALLGSLFLSGLQQAGLSRVDTPYSQRKPFYVFVDEFQDFALQLVSDMQTVFAEARKYKLFLTVCHQNVSQLDKRLIQTILGNVKTILAFRINHSDASMLSPELNPDGKEFLTRKMTELGTGEAFFKIRGKPHRLVKLPLPADVEVDEQTIEELKNFSASHYSRPYQDVENEINDRHKKLGIRKDNSQAKQNNSGGDPDAW